VASRESMHESPRIRRLRNDLTALDRLGQDSSIFQFKATGNPPYHYYITFKGKGLCRDRGKIKLVHTHQVEVKLGASYPRSIPEIRWLTPIYHPNISEIGMVCLGGYGTHWVPSVQLDELCLMLWDMARYHNYDIRSPYNRDAALWVANQTSILFPTDPRALRDLRVSQGRLTDSEGNGKESTWSGDGSRTPRRAGPRSVLGVRTVSESPSALSRVRRFIEQYGGAQVVGSNGEQAPSTSRQALNPVAPAEPPDTQTEESRSAADEAATATVAVSTLIGPAAGPELQDDDVIVLDSWPDPSPGLTHPSTPGGDEIVFLE
jgi:ubiquitin-protein ligase